MIFYVVGWGLGGVLLGYTCVHVVFMFHFYQFFVLIVND